MILTPALERPLVAVRGILETLMDGASDPDVRRESWKAVQTVDSILANPTTREVVAVKMDLFDLQGRARVAGYSNDADALDGIGILLGTIVTALA
jgi:hypothetical protein